MKTAGFVYIVGAGPGSPDLITVKGRRAVRQADVILHDRLVHPQLLTEARQVAKVIDVGKRVGREDEQQEEIHRLMIAHAREGKVVCRLKGGDPFVFGRGAEEVSALVEAGIPYEVVPGVTSLTAAPLAAGITLTHREYAHGFLVITGSRSVSFDSADWQSARLLLKAGGTVVVMMGLARLPGIVKHLIENGCSPELSAAVISRATWSNEEIRFGTLSHIQDDINGLVSPSLLVIGEVVGKAKKGI